MLYKVGQILYMTNSKNMTVIPVQVVEEVIRKNLKGTEKTYLIMLPDKAKTIADINTIKGKLFSNKNEVRKFLLANATKAINEMLENTTKIEQIKFNISAQNLEVKKENIVQENINNDIITVDLGNGLKAKMKSDNLEKVLR
jgi:hypothetical protein